MLVVVSVDSVALKDNLLLIFPVATLAPGRNWHRFHDRPGVFRRQEAVAVAGTSQGRSLSPSR